MMAPAAVELGIELHLLAGSAEASAAQVIPHTVIGDYRSVEDVLAFAKGRDGRAMDAITFDHEHVPAEVLDALAEAGIAMNPGPQALLFAQDKLAMRRAVEDLGLPNPRWNEVHTAEELISFGNAIGWPVVLKTPRGGYDGKGVMIIDDASPPSPPRSPSGSPVPSSSRPACWPSRKFPIAVSSPPRWLAHLEARLWPIQWSNPPRPTGSVTKSSPQPRAPVLSMWPRQNASPAPSLKT